MNRNDLSHNKIRNQNIPQQTFTKPFRKNKICKYYSTGSCRLGSKCRFLHVIKEEDEPVSLQALRNKLDSVSKIIIGKKPVLHIIVLYAGDEEVRSYSEEVRDLFLEKKINCFLQIQTFPKQYIKPEHLVDIINRSSSDYLVVVGDRNMKNRSLQIRFNGKLYEKGLAESVRSIEKLSAKKQNNGDLFSLQSSELTQDNLHEMIELFSGIKHINSKIKRINSNVNSLTSSWNKNDNKKQFLSKFTSIQTNIIRLHKESVNGKKIVERITVEPKVDENRGINLMSGLKLGINIEIKKIVIKECKKIILQIEKLGKKLKDLSSDSSNLWTSYMKAHNVKSEKENEENQNWNTISSKKKKRNMVNNLPIMNQNVQHQHSTPTINLHNGGNFDQHQQNIHYTKRQIAKKKLKVSRPTRSMSSPSFQPRSEPWSKHQPSLFIQTRSTRGKRNSGEKFYKVKSKSVRSYSPLTSTSIWSPTNLDVPEKTVSMWQVDEKKWSSYDNEDKDDFSSFYNFGKKKMINRENNVNTRNGSEKVIVSHSFGESRNSFLQKNESQTNGKKRIKSESSDENIKIGEKVVKSNIIRKNFKEPVFEKIQQNEDGSYSVENINNSSKEKVQICTVCGKEPVIMECSTCSNFIMKGIKIKPTYFCSSDCQLIIFQDHKILHQKIYEKYSFLNSSKY